MPDHWIGRLIAFLYHPLHWHDLALGLLMISTACQNVMQCHHHLPSVMTCYLGSGLAESVKVATTHQRASLMTQLQWDSGLEPVEQQLPMVYRRYHPFQPVAPRVCADDRQQQVHIAGA
jgi:hypothetical protein